MAKKKDRKKTWELVDLGYAYYYGREGEPDYEKAYDCFYHAAKRGNANAMYKLGDMRYHGLCGEKDLNESVVWYKKAEAQPPAGDFVYDEYVAASIAFRIGRALLFGEGTATDVLSALHYLQLAEKNYYSRILSGAGLKFCEQNLIVASYAEKQLPEVQRLLKKTRAELKKLIEMEIPDGWSRVYVVHILSDYQWDMRRKRLSSMTIKKKLNEAREDPEMLHALAAQGYGFL